MDVHFLDRLINSDLGGIHKREAVTVVDSSNTSLPVDGSLSISADGVILVVTDRVLYTALSDASKNNKIYSMHSHALGGFYMKLEADGSNSNGSPHEGEVVYVKNGSSSNTLVGYEGGAWKKVDFTTVLGSAGVWGSITGTLSSQTDLQSALNAKLNLSGGNLTGTLGLPSGTQATGVDGGNNLVGLTPSLDSAGDLILTALPQNAPASFGSQLVLPQFGTLDVNGNTPIILRTASQTAFGSETTVEFHPDQDSSPSAPTSPVFKVTTSQLQNPISGIAHGLSYSPTIGVGGTSAYTSVLVNTSELAVGSGPGILLDLQREGISQLKVDRVGNLFLAGDVLPNVNNSKDLGTSAKFASLTLADITYTAVTAGYSGNSINISYTDGATAGSEIVSVVGTAISVQIQSGVSTTNQIITAIAGFSAAAALVNTVNNNIGAAQSAPVGPFNLSGGLDAAVWANGYINNLSYTPNDNSKWANPQPTTVQQALNRIAAVVGLTTPIP